MQIPVHLSGKGITLSPDQEERIRAAVARLERFFDRLIACHVVVSVPNRWPSGEPIAHAFRLTLVVPGGELAVTRQTKASFAQALDDAFDAARRRLQDYARELRGDVKTAEQQRLGRVVRLLEYEGYGFLRADDGYEVYFHRNSVPQNGFARLEVGTPVRFVEVAGAEGPQASTVIAVGRPEIAAAEPEGGAV
jgi:cold shock CspA family protein/ribosome-associated translation inhibitor RaiA